jgi:outer membrane protein TolC
MVATALKFRPETSQMRAEVNAAGHRLTEQKVKPFLPNVAAGYSNYEFAAGQGGATDANDNREEVTAMIYWKLEGLGFGNAADAREKQSELKLARLREAGILDAIASDVAGYRAEVHAQRTRLAIGSQAAGHAKKSYQLTTARLQEAQGLPIEALDSIRVLAEARQAEIDAMLDYNIAQHRLFAALGTPR